MTDVGRSSGLGVSHRFIRCDIISGREGGRKTERERVGVKVGEGGCKLPTVLQNGLGPESWDLDTLRPAVCKCPAALTPSSTYADDLVLLPFHCCFFGSQL